MVMGVKLKGRARVIQRRGTRTALCYLDELDRLIELMSPSEDPGTPHFAVGEVLDTHLLTEYVDDTADPSTWPPEQPRERTFTVQRVEREVLPGGHLRAGYEEYICKEGLVAYVYHTAPGLLTEGK